MAGELCTVAARSSNCSGNAALWRLVRNLARSALLLLSCARNIEILWQDAAIQCQRKRTHIYHKKCQAPTQLYMHNMWSCVHVLDWWQTLCFDLRCYITHLCSSMEFMRRKLQAAIVYMCVFVLCMPAFSLCSNNNNYVVYFIIIAIFDVFVRVQMYSSS